MRNRFKNKYFRLWLTLFLVGISLITFHYVISNMGDISGAINTIGNILFPFLLGGVLAYLLCPVYNFTVKFTYRHSISMFKTKRRTLNFARIMGSIASILILCFVVGGVLWMIIPELIRSVSNIIASAPENLNKIRTLIELELSKGSLSFAEKSIRDALNQLQYKVVSWSKEGIVDSLDVYIQKITEGVLFTFKTILNVLVSVIIAVYLLNGKEVFLAQSKKIVIAKFSEETRNKIFDFFTFTNKTFGGFINGKIIDSIIIGILTYITMNIIGLPYPLLISAIIGITNIIPFFGPFIGAIPSAIIILTVDPIQAVYFALMILVIQQLDGNVIGPKILGGTVGLPSFWIMFAIIIGGGLFGFIGMVLGVPVFAIIYYYFSRHIVAKLDEKNMPSDTNAYQNFDKYNIDKEDIL